MGVAVASGAVLSCSFGAAPSTLTVLPTGKVLADGVPMASIMDHRPNVNIAPFAMCTTPSNPQVAAATAAAQGVLTPQPCVPVTVAPWVPGATGVLVGTTPALTSTCTCSCTWGGVITIQQPGTRTTQAT